MTGSAMTFDPYLTPFDLESLRGVYDAAAASPVDVIEAAFERVAAQRRSNVWISLVPRAEAVDAARRIADRGRDGQPLFGLPFAVKDNIDVQDCRRPRLARTMLTCRRTRRSVSNDSRRPARSVSARPISTSSPPGSQACVRPMGPAGRRSTRP